MEKVFCVALTIALITILVGMTGCSRGFDLGIYVHPIAFVDDHKGIRQESKGNKDRY